MFFVDRKELCQAFFAVNDYQRHTFLYNRVNIMTYRNSTLQVTKTLYTKQSVKWCYLFSLDGTASTAGSCIGFIHKNCIMHMHLRKENDFIEIVM